MVAATLWQYARAKKLSATTQRLIPSLLVALFWTLATPAVLHEAPTPGTQNPNAQLRVPLRFVFLDSTSEAAQAALGRRITNLDGIIGDWLTANADGTITEQEEADDPGDNIEAALRVPRSRQLQILAMVSEEDGRGAFLTRSSQPEFRQKLEHQIVESVQRHDFDGIIINLSDLQAPYAPHLSAFVAELKAQLLPAKKIVGIFVPGESALDYAALAAASDFVIVKLFREELAEAGPLAPMAWSRRVTALRSADIPADKLIFALGSFGKDWSDDANPQTISFHSAMLAAAAPGVQINFDQASGNPLLQVTDPDNHQHQVWFLDAVTFYNQIRHSIPLIPRGYALWQLGLGSEDDTIWRLFSHEGLLHLPDPSALEDIPSDHFTNTVGQGEIYRFLSRPAQGQRTITRTTTGVIEEEYRTIPRPWQIEASGIRPGAIALTFDDGPDPQYTDRILDILKREQVEATFFVTGAQALKHIATIERILNEGHELGNHSWTHPNLSKLPDFLVRLELNATQRLLQVITGRSVRLLRPPYASDDMAETAEEAHVVELGSRLGYVLVGANLNPQDWNRPSKQEIVRRVIEQAERGAGCVVELHDAGGDRTNTVDALPDLIHSLRDRGFHFISIADLMGETNAIIPISEGQRGWVAMARLAFHSMSFERKVLVGAVWIFILLTSARFIMLLIPALLEHHSRKAFSDQTPSVGVIIPAYNEEAVIVRCIAAVLKSDYANLREILVVDDGSADRTAEIATKAFADNPKVRVFTKANAGKWSALNFGLERMLSEVAVMIDADTLLQTDAIRMLARHFGDPQVGAVAGNAKVGNRTNLITKLQAFEYVTSQNLERAGLAKLDAITVVPGAIGAWRREAVRKAGGYSSATLAEDCDLTFGIHRAGYKIVHDMEAIAWTEAPDTWRGFMRQRFRWIYGTLQASYRHVDALFQLKFRSFAYFSLPSIFLFTVLLPLVSPVMDLFLLVTVVQTAVDIFMHPMSYNLQSFGWSICAYLFVFGIDTLIALLAFGLEPNEDRRLLAYLPLQRFCYRQVLYIVVIRVLLACLRGNAQGWNKLARVGSVAIGSQNAASG
jgi:peptidoglycan-N-acetylglucosamine deacetylase